MIKDLLKSFEIESDVSTDTIPAAIPQHRKEVDSSGNYVPTEYHQQIVKELEESVKVHDVCLMGARGSGKSTIIKQLASQLSLEIEPIMLYQVTAE